MLNDLLIDFRASSAASEQDVDAAVAGLGRPLPTDYIRFLLTCDGGEGFIGTHYLILWRASQLVDFNKGYEVPIYAPGFLMFGSTGGGDGFAFDTRVGKYDVVQVPFIGMSHEDGFRVAASFTELLQRMSTTQGSLF